ncbi:DEAD/DEAH box helicase [Paenibacillus xerothermodurans]|uniref:ATP-dependent helicase n=1 Tax=Paenibacillus xerothermodurans TaxID=1977292 RepID=A0A2W1NAC0_PAEXE|nr:DEAD/DEAH box helicase [Paenibacillus xerothermodurans]PZE20121.1 ATP-dependent helicase [Paenibacillus xerothermodurans]
MDSMIDTTALTVHARWISPGVFFLWATRHNGAVADATDLKNLLFAWHQPSFYGTFIETMESMNVEGLQLPALEALDYFCSPSTVQHLKLEWNGELRELLRLAPHVKEALVKGRVMPDFAKWKAGELGWKLQLPEGVAAAGMSPLAQQWMERLIPEWAEEDATLRQSISQLEQAYPLLQRGTLPTDLWMDEEDWLVSIGWHTDGTPFRTCLQLSEPPQGRGSWPLRVILQDRADKDVLREVDAAALETAAQIHAARLAASPDAAGGADTARDGAAAAEREALSVAGDDTARDAVVAAEREALLAAEPELAALPEAWLPHLHRAAKDLAKWRRIQPSLQKDEDTPALRTELSQDDAWQLLTQGSLRLMEAGYSVFLPAWWERIRRWRPKLKAKVKSSIGTGPQAMFGLQQLMQFDWKVAVGDVELTEEEFRTLLEEKRNLVQIRGQWIQLDPEQLQELEQVMQQVQNKRGLSFRDVLELHLLGSIDDEEEFGFERSLQMEVELDQHLQEMVALLNHSRRPPLIEPPASFRGTLRPYQIEGISWLLFLRQAGLGGCLADDMGLGKTIQMITYLLHLKEDEEEVGQHAASIGSRPESVEHPPSLLICPTSVLGNWQKELERFAPKLKIYLHYGPHRVKGDAFIEACRGSDLVLTTYTLSHLDEAELTPVEWNSICLDEAQNIKNAYTKQATSIRNLNGRHRIALTGTPIENRLTELWSIFDFLNPGYLGPLREFTHRYVNAIEKTNDPGLVGKVQRLIRPFLLRRVKKDPAIQLDLPDKHEYKTYVSLTAEQGSLYENYINDMFERLDRLSVMERRGLILAALTKLKQICNHPSLMLKEPEGAPWQNRSNKVERLLEMVHELRQEGDKCLIFTQFVETGHLLQRILEQELEPNVPFLHGGTPKAGRDRMIAEFQGDSLPAERQPGVFILSLKAGGTGLNLTAANHVFHFDRWWNPAVENQATDRAFRIGQTRQVQVHKFVTLGTLEERIDEMIEKKQGLSQQIVGSGEQWITEMSTDDLRELFALRSEWVEV